MSELIFVVVMIFALCWVIVAVLSVVGAHQDGELDGFGSRRIYDQYVGLRQVAYEVGHKQGCKRAAIVKERRDRRNA